jgi:hypothetical protein
MECCAGGLLGLCCMVVLVREANKKKHPGTCLDCMVWACDQPLTGTSTGRVSVGCADGGGKECVM